MHTRFTSSFCIHFSTCFRKARNFLASHCFDPKPLTFIVPNLTFIYFFGFGGLSTGCTAGCMREGVTVLILGGGWGMSEGPCCIKSFINVDGCVGGDTSGVNTLVMSTSYERAGVCETSCVEVGRLVSRGRRRPPWARARRSRDRCWRRPRTLRPCWPNPWRRSRCRSGGGRRGTRSGCSRRGRS